MIFHTPPVVQFLRTVALGVFLSRHLTSMLCLLVIAILVSPTLISAGPNEWTWMKGSSAAEQVGTYGTLGVESPDNIPGARGDAASWTDRAGNQWLFGGVSNSGYFNDLWKYSPSTGNWTWIKGSSLPSQSGIYGTRGVAAPGNSPGARFASVSWTDNAGNLWLFGGSGYGSFSSGYLNDLWKYDPLTGNWTWMKGSTAPGQSGVYGTQGVAASANTPGARDGAVSWADNAGILWLYGGLISGASGTGFLNDLWKYNPSSGNWTWMKGSTVRDQSGVYGNQGAAASSNVPGSRMGAVSWIDNAECLWLFGGFGYSSPSYGRFNDLWKYNPSTGDWTWMKGSNGLDQVGIFGSQGVAASGNTPGALSDAVSWADSAGSLWLFGGYGNGSPRLGVFQDLWVFDMQAGNWTWIKGVSTTDQPGVYGSQGVAAPGNSPGGRSNSASWSDAGGNMWLFGGHGYSASGVGELNDLWKFSVPPASAIDWNDAIAY